MFWAYTSSEHQQHHRLLSLIEAKAAEKGIARFHLLTTTASTPQPSMLEFGRCVGWTLTTLPA